MPKNTLDFGDAVSIIVSSTGSGSVVCAADGQTRARCFWRADFMDRRTQKEVIMTSERKNYGSQDFFALDIPIT
jgi:hypothetical protein